MRGMIGERVFERVVIPCLVALVLVALGAKPLLACEEPPGDPPDPCHCFARIEAPLPPPGCDPYGQALCSGTKCTAGGVITGSNCPGTPNTFVSWARLFIGGELVAKYDNPNGSECWVPLTVTWASTHFAHNSEIEVKIDGQDTAGCYCSATKNVKIYNRAYVATGHQPAGCGSDLNWGNVVAQDVVNKCHTMNIATSGPETCCAATSMLSSMPAYTVYFLHTHGDNCHTIWDCQCGKDGTQKPCHSHDECKLTDTAIASAVGSKAMCTQPPFGFVDLWNCCNCAQTCGGDTCCALADAFQVHTSGRALLGWRSLVLDSSENANWQMSVWAELVVGKTINDAVVAASSQYAPDAESPGDHAALWMICGSGLTTLNSVYGYPGHPGYWFWPQLPT